MIKSRLETIASLVWDGTIPADIGTDHAYVPVMLVREGKCEKVYACDIGEGPLESAKRTIGKEGLEGKVIPVLSDGLDHVPEDADALIIAGMGCSTAVGILERGRDRLPAMKQIIVAVNNHNDDFRRWISDNGYTILDEAFVKDRDHEYTIEVFCTEPHGLYSPEEIVLGPVLMETAPEDYIRYISQITDNMMRWLTIGRQNDPAWRKAAIYNAWLDRWRNEK